MPAKVGQAFQPDTESAKSGYKGVCSERAMRRARKQRPQSEVELNVASMLDMAFQLLAFFILTFRPAPLEGQISLRLPPPQPITGGAQPAWADTTALTGSRGVPT